MDILIQQPTKTNPYICLDPTQKRYEITGQSFPEDPMEVFAPIFKWLEANLPTLNHKMEMQLQATYFNSASNRLLLKMFRLFEVQVQAGKEIEIHWLYDDEEVENDGVIFSKLVNIPFKFIHKPFKD